MDLSPNTLSRARLNMGTLETQAFDKNPMERPMIATDHPNKPAASKSATFRITGVSQHPPATSVLLQGNPRSALRTLFLFPDGSGSAASYTQLGRISKDVVVYGLNCPYLRSPEKWHCGPQDLTPRYLDEIRRRQPEGPYYLGGWSTGGICAFDAAQTLDREGERIERLILIDAPCPIHLKRLPPRLMDFLKEIHAFGSRGRNPPTWLYAHFEANTESLQKYRVRPFAAYHEPSTHIIWARLGVCESESVVKAAGASGFEVREDDPKEMKWIMEKREDFGALGWERLLSYEDLHIGILDRADHFSMMQGDNAKRLAGLIEQAMS